MSSRNAISGDVYRDQQLMLGLTAQAGKLGLQTPEFDLSQSRSQLLQSRANFRKIIDGLQQRAHDLIGQNKDADDVVAAVETAASIVSKISQHLDTLDALAGQPRGSGDTVRIDGRAVKVLRNAADYHEHYERRAQESGEQRVDGIGLGDFVKAVAGMKVPGDVRAALSVGTDGSGGYAVPSILMPGILEALTASTSLLNAGCGVVPLAEGAKSYTVCAVDAAPTAAWRSEAGAVVESDPSFRAITVVPRSLAFHFKVSRELLADAPDLDGALRTAIAQAMAVALDAAGLRGSGVAPTPRGLLNVSGVQAVTNGANGASLATTKFANLHSAVQAIMEASGPTPTAVIGSPRSIVGLSSLVDTTGQPLSRPPLLQAMRFVSTVAIPDTLTVGSSTDCSELYVADFSTCNFYMRETLSIQIADQMFAVTGQVGFICHARADFAPSYPAAIAVVTGVRP